MKQFISRWLSWKDFRGYGFNPQQNNLRRGLVSSYGAIPDFECNLTRNVTVCFLAQPGVFTAPFPYWHHFSLPPTTGEEEIVKYSLHQLEILLSQQVVPKETAAILIEPVLGEGGYVPAPSAYLHGLRDICDKHGILLILDEVQSGFGRTGKYFATEYCGVKPDILVIAKVSLLVGTDTFVLNVDRRDEPDHLKDRRRKNKHPLLNTSLGNSAGQGLWRRWAAHRVV